jgi:hypothetical protein
MKTLRCSLVVLLLGLSVPVAASAQVQPTYSLNDVIAMIEAKYSAEQMLREIGTACLGFPVQSNEARLQRAGADAAIITALRGVCYRPPAAGPPPREGVLNIVGELPRNWSRTANRLLPSTVRTVTLTPGRQGTIVVNAPGWCPDTLVLTMQAAESRNWEPKLRPRPWVGGC